MAILNQEIDFIHGMDYLGGMDSIKLDLHGKILSGSNPAPLAGSGGQQTSCVIKMVNRQYDLADVFQLDAAVSIRYAAVGGGSAKYNFFNSTKLSQFTLDLIIYVSVRNAQTTVDLGSLVMKEEARQLYTDNINQFFNTYGDVFIYGLITGGELFAKLSVKSEDFESIKRMSAALEASGGLGAWSGSASVAAFHQIREAISSYELTSEISRFGTKDPVPNPRDQNELIDYALSFPTKVLDATSVPFKALIMPYTSVFPPSTDPINRQNQSDTLRDLWSHRCKLVSNLYDYEYAIQNPDQFEGLDVKKVEDSYDKTNDAKSKVELCARRCFDKAENCSAPGSDIIDAERLNLPPRKEGASMNQLSVGTVLASVLSEDLFQSISGKTWVLCDGRNVEDSKYHKLTNKRNIPDLRGVFLRGKNGGRFADVEEIEVGELRTDTFKSHTHEIVDNGHQHPMAVPDGGGSPEAAVQWNIVNRSVVPDKLVQPSKAYITLKEAGDNETKPKNVTVNYFVKIN